MINSERTLNIYTTVLLDGLKGYEFNSLSDREKEIIQSAKTELGSFPFNEGKNISTGFFNSNNSNILPVLITAIFSFKDNSRSLNISPIVLLNSLNITISNYITGTLDRNSTEYSETINFLQFFNNEYNKKIYLSNVQSNSLIYA